MSDFIFPTIVLAMVVMFATFFITKLGVKFLVIGGFVAFMAFASFNAADTQQGFTNNVSSFVSDTPAMRTITDGLKVN